MVEVIVTRKYQVTIPRKVREALGISIGDRLVVKVVDGKIVMKPVRPEKALEKLAGIANKYLWGSRRIDVVRLVEESLERETGIH